MKNQLNPEAQKYFDELKTILTESGRYSPGDDVPLRRLSHLYSLCDRFEQEMNSSWSEKFVKQNLNVYDKILRNTLALEVVFQLNPGSRSRGKVKPVKEKMKFDTTMRKSL